MRLKQFIFAGLVASLVTAVTGHASALTPYPFENYTDVPDGMSAPFVGNWAVRIAGRPGRTVSTCAVPFEIEASDARSIIYRSPSDPEAEIDLIAEDNRTTWESNVPGGGFLAVWLGEDSFYLYDQDAPDLGGPYSFSRCD